MLSRSSAFARVVAALSRTRRRLRLRAGLDASGWMIAAVGAMTLIGVLLGALVSSGSGLRLLVVISMTGLPTAALFRFFIIPWWKTRSDEAVAAHVERGAPELRDGLLAAVELRADPTRAEDPALIAALAGQVAARLDAVDLAALTPMAPARRAWLAAGAVIATWAVFLLAAPDTLRRGVASLLPDGAHGLLGAEETGPLVGDLTLTLHYPAHTGRPPRTIPNSAGDLEAPKGTRVELTATTLEPASAAALRFGDAEAAEVALAVTEARELRGEFVVTGGATWRFALTTPEGRQLVEGMRRAVKIEPDQPPQVTLELPAEDLELEDLRGVPVAWRVRDDFGLSRVQVVVALAADPEHPERLAQPGVSGRQHQGQDEVDLDLVEAQAGDRLALFVEAFDNNGVDGPQRGVSITRYITVRSPQAKHYALSEELRATIDLLLDGLADRLEMEWFEPAAGPLPPRIAGLVAGTAKAAAALEKVVTGMVEDPLTPEEVRLALAGRLGALEETMAVEAAALDGAEAALVARQDGAVRRSAKASAGVIVELEKAIILVEAMVARLALEDMAALAEELKAAKEKLKDLVQQYKQNPDDEALKARIMREVKRLRRRIDEMRQRMAQLRQKLPEEFLNLDGMKKDEVGKGLDKTKDQLAELEKMLEEGKLDEALAALEELEKSLDELSSSLDKDLDDLHKSSNPEMQQALSELMDQTRNLMKRQEELAKETDALAKARQEALRKLLEEQFAEKMKALKAKGEALEREVALVNPNQMSSLSAEELGHLEERVRELRGALERDQLMESLEMSERTLDRLDRLQRFNRGRMDGEENERHLRQAEAVDREIVQELLEMIDKARAQQRQQQQQAQQGEGSPSEQMSRRQQALSEAARKLQERLSEQGKKIPGMGDKPMQSAEQARQSMEDAARRLGQQRPGQARPGQQQAMESLQGLMEGLKQANQPKRADRQRNRGPNSQERVNVPGAEDYEAPEAWRKELLEAMKDAPPEQFREQVKRYYEALIQ